MTEPATEPIPSCPVCGEPTRAGTWTTCAACITRTDHHLAEIVGLHQLAALPEYLIPAWSSAAGVGPIGGSHEPPIGVNVDALDLAIGEHALGVLESWERWWREVWGLAPYGDASSARLSGPQSHGTGEVAPGATSRNLRGTVAFLRARWPIAAAAIEPPPGEFADEVRRLHSHALGALGMTPFDRDPDPDAVEPFDWTITCPADITTIHGDGTETTRICGHRIGMRRQPHDQHEPIRINCPRCGTRWDTRRLIAVAIAAGARVEMSLTEAMDHYGCTERTIRRWVERGEFQRVGNRYAKVTAP